MLKFRGVILAVLVVAVGLPAAAQLRSGRTMMDAPKRERPKADATTTPEPPPPPPSQADQTPAPPPATQTTTTQTTTTQTTTKQTVAEPSKKTGTTALMALDAAGEPDEKLPCDKVTLPNKFPLRNPKYAPCFWNQQDFEWLSGAEMVGSNGSVAATTEVLSDFLRGWRISFTTAVASPADEEDENGEGDAGAAAEENDGDDATTEAKQDTAANLFRANGGNLALAAAYPLYARTFKDTNGGFMAITYGRAAGTFSAFGDLGPSNSQSLDWSELNGNLEWALKMIGRVITTGNRFDIEVYTNLGAIAGTKQFRKTLGIDGGAGLFGRGEAGVNFRLQNMVIGASYNYYTANGLDRGATLTLGWIPQPKAPEPADGDTNGN